GPPLCGRHADLQQVPRNDLPHPVDARRAAGQLRGASERRARLPPAVQPGQSLQWWRSTPAGDGQPARLHDGPARPL
ncbi:MAG: hypothetical protein AVDCRST_MAG10-849, partial [uncultured Acidimicrobiales bacterium]